ncbi:competence type IV pilus minor pilin ComGF [Oceanobacillus salinisoli]|uniref:competence type IV pilus minor pilin ComGF n=1 Tax=Oceanobacillus salinisoli TaxID=2678611 RepID=UPI0012E2A2E1|nr:competence type IV pilus minor pilin ComGF [Oceanobacillus salinisoli]
MLEKKQKHSVFMGCLKIEKGFSYVTMLLAITIISMTLPFIGYLIQATSQLSSNYHELSTQQFFQFLRDELIQSTEVNIYNNKMKLTQGETIATIEHYEDVIRRQVDGTGHEILLRDVQNADFRRSPYGITIQITNSKGEIYDKNIVFYH